MGSVCEIEMEGTTSSISLARSFVGATLAAWELEVLCDVAVLLTSELATNVVLHAKSDYSVAVLLDGDLTVEVRDRSHRLPEVDADDRLPDGGRGLVIVSGLADRWGTRPEPGGKTVWFSLDLPR